MIGWATEAPIRRRKRRGDAPSPARQAAGASASARLEQEVAFLMRGLEAAQRLHKFPLERAHYLALLVLEAQGPQTVAAIAHHLLLDDSTVTRQVIEMEQEGLVAKRPNPADRRSALVDVTARGLSEAKRMRDERTERIDALVRGWSERQRETFAVLLGRFNAALARRAREGSGASERGTDGAAPK